MFRSAAVGPPTSVFSALLIATPPPPMTTEPVESRPMMFPWMVVSDPLAIEMFAFRFPEMTFPAPATEPPIVVPLANSRVMPNDPPVVRASFPAASMPT